MPVLASRKKPTPVREIPTETGDSIYEFKTISNPSELWQEINLPALDSLSQDTGAFLGRAG